MATFGRAGYLVRVMLTQAAGDAARFAAQWGGDFDLVVCAGGDGTLNETLSGLMQLETRPPVGYLPNGSTNDFAASLRIPATVPEAARAVVEGTPGPWIWAPTTTGISRMWRPSGPFQVLLRVPGDEERPGSLCVILEGIKNLDSLRPYRCAVEATARCFDGEFIFGAVCNSTSLGGLVKLDPKRVHMDDGMFELILLRMPKNRPGPAKPHHSPEPNGLRLSGSDLPPRPQRHRHHPRGYSLVSGRRVRPLRPRVRSATCTAPCI